VAVARQKAARLVGASSSSPTEAEMNHVPTAYTRQMATEGEARARTVARTVLAEQLEGGDHSCLTSGDADARWRVLTAHTWAGLARGEKVLIIPDPSDLSDDEAVTRMDGGSGRVEAARDAGQLEFRRNTHVYLPDGRFDKERQLAGYTAEVERAQQEGWSRLRAAADMSWAGPKHVSRDELLDYETSLGPVYANRGLIGLCWYDQERTKNYLVAARDAHPVRVMECLDAIEATQIPNGGRIAGWADLSTRAEFGAALRAALARPDDGVPCTLELDLTALSFMEAYCASQLITAVSSLPEGSRVTVSCGPILELVLRGLGADDVPQLELNVVEEPSDQECA
jgi:hypothetical protein